MEPVISDLAGAGYGSAARAKRSAVSWGAVAAGAIAAAALSLILLMLGVGLGMSSVSPWAGEGVGATTFGVSTIVWLTLTQLVASGMGGYMAGRLRTRWAGVASDEVYFRDTAHGFLAWAVASLATAALLSSAVTGIVGGAATAGATAATAAATTAAAGAAAAGAQKGGPASMMQARGDTGGNGYAIDVLFRGAASTAQPATAVAPSTQSPSSGMAASETQVPFSRSIGASAMNGEVTRIFEHSLAAGELSADDARYAAQLVAQRTGVGQAEAEKRVADGFARISTSMRDAQAQAKEAADKARKATAYGTLWIFISLLIGAFVASLSATYGGRQRDAAPLTI